MPRSAFWFVCALLAGLVLAKFDPTTGFTSLLRFGETWADRRHPAIRPLAVATVPASSGYDGQFYAQVALDPLLRDPAKLAASLDAPAYRARRILAPATAAVLGGGQPRWVLQAFALLNVAAWFAFAWLLRAEIPGTGWTAAARWIGCVLSLGVLESVRQSLVDLPALLLLLLAVRADRARREQRTTLWLALGHLTKETNALASAALLAGPRPDWRRLGPFLLSLAPLALWMTYVADRLPSATAGGSGLGNFTWPLLGLFDQAQLSLAALQQGASDSRHLWFFIAVAAFGVQAAVLWRQRDAGSAWWRLGAAYALLMLFLGPWVWSGYWAVARAVLPLTIAFNLLLPAGRTFWPLWLVGNATALHGLWRFL